jgi:hypothetical protein
VQHLARATRRFEIFAAEIPQTELQALAGRGLLDDVGMTFELVSDGRADEIGSVRIKIPLAPSDRSDRGRHSQG